MTTMNETKKVRYLVVDTSAFISHAPLQDIGINILTEQAVIDEITSKRQLRRLIVLPYDLKVREAFNENIKFVTEFSKKTGDYISLSATDIKVIALAYQLEKVEVGTVHLRNAPILRTITSDKKNNPKPMFGFYLPMKSEKKTITDNILVSNQCIEEKDVKNNITQDFIINNVTNKKLRKQFNTSLDKFQMQNLTEKFAKLDPTDIEGENENENILIGEIESERDESIEDDDDDYGWITPNNLNNTIKQMDSEILGEKAATVACLTTDFAMQNVLLQMGLNVVSLDGKMIKQIRTFIFRCHACFKTTSIMTKIFCPHCGNKTLKKVEVILDENGTQQIHINFRKTLSAKGKKFSLPMPKGGKHSNNPILCEDQPIPDQRTTHLARTKNNPLDDDYIAGFSPFITRDINSKSAMLGIRPNGAIKYWMKKNPNESRRRRK